MTVTDSKKSLQQPASWIGLAAWMILCFSVAGVGALATTPEIDGWYKTLDKPAWNPPNSVFGPVWTMLYAMMAIAVWLVWKRDALRNLKRPLTCFAIQLLFNAAWSWVFFYMHEPGWAFLVIVFLWLAIVATTAAFFQISKLAGSLMLPYLAWVSFAAALNYSIWQLNAAS